MKKVILLPKKTDAVKRFHPWIFSGAIQSTDAQDGEVVEVVDSKGNFLAIGYYSLGSIAVRIISFEPINSLQELWLKIITRGYEKRKVVGLVNQPQTNVYRLVNAEGDNCPGLIIDFYAGTCVFQAHAPFIYNQKESIVEALKTVLGNELKAVYDKSSATLSKKHTIEAKDGYLFGTAAANSVLENGLQFKIDWELGQKTGFFVDQRENRKLLSTYSKDKIVLNTFCYTGGFSVYALANGAQEVHSVDSSAKAMEATDVHVKLNGFEENHTSYTNDIFDFFRDAKNDFYDVIILDPPAFAKGLSARHQAVQAYKRLNKIALTKIKKGGVLFTFSCSQAVSTEFFNSAVMAAAIETGREISILHHLTQPADHPVNIYHPEGLYLKGLVLLVN